MKRHFVFFWLGFIFLALPLLSIGSVHAQDDGLSPTPTYDPLKEPVVPENPSEYELGRNWYWNYCMPCHGDKGQGLTDEWRAVWEPDHQDCWGKGCHAGKSIDDSFVIPTIVPAVVSDAQLTRFSSLDSLCEYLKITHPPQSPGCLEDEQYQAIALYMFVENHRSLVGATPTMMPTPNPTNTALPEAVPVEESSPKTNFSLYIGLGAIVVVLAIWGLRKRR